MKVRVVLSVEVDADEWALDQGVDSRARTIAEDVKSYVLYHVQEASAPIVRAELAR